MCELKSRVRVVPARRIDLWTEKRTRLTGILAICLAIAACGGGGGDGSSSSGPPAQKPAVSTAQVSGIQVKMLRFTWEDAASETEYRLLESLDGIVPYSIVTVLPSGSTSYDHEVFLPDRANATYLVQTCNGALCQDTGPISASTALTSAIGYLKASNPGNGDRFGVSVALSGDGTTLAVGAPLEDSNSTGINGLQSADAAPDSGAVYVFRKLGAGQWVQEAYIKATNTDTGDRFGHTLALSSDGATLAVGAPFEDSSARGVDGNQLDESATDSGAVYVFTRSGGGIWSQSAYLKPTPPTHPTRRYFTGEYRFGFSLALSGSGNVMVVGAPGHGNYTEVGVPAIFLDGGVGTALIFQRVGGAWSQSQALTAQFGDTGDFFGWSTCISGDGSTVAVGATDEGSGAVGIGGDPNNNSAGSSGAAFLYGRASTSTPWVLDAYVKPNTSVAGARFGGAMSCSANGSTVAVSRNTNGGEVHIFTKSASWSHQATIASPDPIPFGGFGASLSLSITGDKLVATMPGESTDNQGINGNRLNALAPNSGAAFLFGRSGTTWSQSSFLKAPTPESGDLCSSVVMASAADLIALGCTGEDGGSTGIGGNQTSNAISDSGAVLLF